MAQATLDPEGVFLTITVVQCSVVRTSLNHRQSKVEIIKGMAPEDVLVGNPPPQLVPALHMIDVVGHGRNLRRYKPHRGAERLGSEDWGVDVAQRLHIMLLRACERGQVHCLWHNGLRYHEKHAHASRRAFKKKFHNLRLAVMFACGVCW